MKNGMDCAMQRPRRYHKPCFARCAASGMVMLELQFAILILGVGVAANLSLQTQALQLMIDTARHQEAALLRDESDLLGLGSPWEVTLTASEPAELSLSGL